jgi:hypothetical protein
MKAARGLARSAAESACLRQVFEIHARPGAMATAEYRIRTD